MPPPGYGGRMNPEDRQRLRDDVRWSNREPQREYRDLQREDRMGRLTPQEREQLRRDIQEANREMPRDMSRDRPRR